MDEIKQLNEKELENMKNFNEQRLKEYESEWNEKKYVELENLKTELNIQKENVKNLLIKGNEKIGRENDKRKKWNDSWKQAKIGRRIQQENRKFTLRTKIKRKRIWENGKTLVIKKIKENNGIINEKNSEISLLKVIAIFIKQGFIKRSK